MKKYVLFDKKDREKLEIFYKSVAENNFVEIESIFQILINLYSDASLFLTVINLKKFLAEILNLKKLLKHCRIFNVGKLFQKIN